MEKIYEETCLMMKAAKSSNNFINNKVILPELSKIFIYLSHMDQ